MRDRRANHKRRQLNQHGMLATLDHLGEGVESELDARNAAQEYVQLVDSIQAAGLRSNASLKLTHFGIDLSEDLAFNLVLIFPLREAGLAWATAMSGSIARMVSRSESTFARPMSATPWLS